MSPALKLACVTASYEESCNSSQSSTSDSEDDFLLDMWDDWMGSDSEFYLLHYQIMYFKIGVTFKK